jgi:hypothetical protein
MAISTTSGTFGATGESSTVVVKRATVGIDGGATATVVVQAQLPGGSTWYDCHSFTADDTREIEFCKARNVRLSCTNYTSGTVTYCIDGVER